MSEMLMTFAQVCVVQGVNALLKAWAAKIAGQQTNAPEIALQWQEGWGGAVEFTDAAPEFLREAVAPVLPERRKPVFQTECKITAADTPDVHTAVYKACDEEALLGASLFIQMHRLSALQVSFPDFHTATALEPHSDSATEEDDDLGNEPAITQDEFGMQRSATEENGSSATARAHPAVKPPNDGKLSQLGVVLLVVLKDFTVRNCSLHVTRRLLNYHPCLWMSWLPVGGSISSRRP